MGHPLKKILKFLQKKDMVLIGDENPAVSSNIQVQRELFYLSFLLQIIKDVHFQNKLLSSDDRVWKVQENEERLKSF